MKNFVTFILSSILITFFAVFGTYIAEITNLIQFSEQSLEVKFEENGEDLIMTWQPIPYPCKYKIETVSRTSGTISGVPEYHLQSFARVEGTSFKVPRTAIPNYYFISAVGIFGGKIFEYEKPIANPNFPSPVAPVSIFKYTEENKASLMPFLVWHTVPDAVCYEVEILSSPPQIEGGIEPSKKNQLMITHSIFTNGYQVDLRPFKDEKEIYWRVRALNLHLKPVGEFSRAERIFIDENKPLPNCPLINNFDKEENFQQPVYPVYDWIPLNKADKYEIELSDHPPAVEFDTEPDPESLWRQIATDSSSRYDEYGRPYAGIYYWRVRALDEKNNPVGTWSHSGKFTMPDYTGGVDVAIFGDSISHGGGAVSYSPASLEYSYANYLDFPAVNISRSGDTSKTTAERFEKDVLPLKPKNLIILTGSNSLRSTLFTADDIISDLSKIERLCRRNNIRPIFLTLMPINPKGIFYVFHTPTDPNWKDKLKRVNRFIREQQYYIDIEPYFYDIYGDLSEDLSTDGLHPDIRGKMIIGEEINKHKDLFAFSEKKTDGENFPDKILNLLRKLKVI